MTIEWNDGVLQCAGTLAVDDAEQLLQVLQGAGTDAPGADLAGCEHVHSACLQVLMAARVEVREWPAAPALAAWLRAALEPMRDRTTTTDNNQQ
jgi:ABC-type transporter Mla MlaB component